MSRRRTDVRWLDEHEAQAWRWFLRTQARLNTQLDRELREKHGLSLAYYDVMATLSAQPDHQLRATELADLVVLSPSTLTRRLDSMEQRGLVARRRCREDARGVYVALTDDGFKALEKAAPSHVDAVRRHFIDGLTRTEIEVLARIGRESASR